MPDINWPELLLGLFLTGLYAEATGWLPRIARRIIQMAARRLPHRARRREEEWLEQLEDKPTPWSQLFHALHCMMAAGQICRACPPLPGHTPRASTFMRVLLTITRLQALFFFALLALVDSSWLLFGLLSTTPPQLAGLVWLHLAGLLLYALNWHGLGRDWPWLRSTPIGAALLLSLATWPVFYMLTTGHGPSEVSGMLWIGSVYTMWAWEGYWDGKRPLRKRGLLALFIFNRTH